MLLGEETSYTSHFGISPTLVPGLTMGLGWSVLPCTFSRARWVVEASL